MSYVRRGTCQHPAISDVQLMEREALFEETWGRVEHLICPDCKEYLYPDGDPEMDGVVYVGEPNRAGEPEYVE